MGKRVNDKSQIKTPAKRVETEPDSPPKGRRFLVWRFGHLDHETAFNCQKLLRTDVQDLEAELATFQRLTIPTLQRKKWLKFIPADQMTPEGRKALSEVNPQENGLWQLHLLRYKWRVWGYFSDPEFFFLWWDGDHAVAKGKWRHRDT